MIFTCTQNFRVQNRLQRLRRTFANKWQMLVARCSAFINLCVAKYTIAQLHMSHVCTIHNANTQCAMNAGWFLQTKGVVERQWQARKEAYTGSLYWVMLGCYTASLIILGAILQACLYRALVSRFIHYTVHACYWATCLY